MLVVAPLVGRPPAALREAGREPLLVVLGRDPPLERGAGRLVELELGRDAGRLVELGRDAPEREGAGERLAASSSKDSPQVPPDSSSSHSATVRMDPAGAMNSEDGTAACAPAPEHPHGRSPEEPDAYSSLASK